MTEFLLIKRRRIAWSALVFLLVIVTVTTAYNQFVDAVPAFPVSGHYQDGRFHNAAPRPQQGFLFQAKLFWDFFFNKPAGTLPDRTIPVRTVTRAELLAAPDNSVYRLGHSTLLFKMHHKFWITDPVFSKRASPVQWMGPARFHAPPISIEELPPIEAVILSHNHYDHLDYAAVRALAEKTRLFIAPLGVGETLASWGVPASQIRELDWWQTTEIDSIRFVATPAQHFSGRSPTDSDKTLWCSWAIISDDFRLFFSGDSGYFDGFKSIGQTLGPFDAAFIETGAYDKRWEYVHMLPEQTIQAFKDLRGKWLFPIHNGTFDLAMHVWDDPFTRIADLATAHRINMSTPEMGERVDFSAPHAGASWWKD